MYFCTPTTDPYEALAYALQTAYPRPQLAPTLREAAKAASDRSKGQQLATAA